MKPIVCILLLLLIDSFGISQDVARLRAEELIEHYKEYNGKSVVIEGTASSSEEGTFLYLKGKNHADDPVLLAFSNELGPSEKKLVKKLKKQTSVEVVLRGVFNGADGRIWGHLMCCRYRLQLQEVMSAK